MYGISNFYPYIIWLNLQAQELRKYFKSLGAEISEEKSAKGIEDDLHKIVGVCDVCFKETSESDIEAILNSIVSIMVSVCINWLPVYRYLSGLMPGYLMPKCFLFNCV